jgi:crotonobetainyl-CoA:carnitine CoA-transferase CaiB-like acyl-CoA transferase
VAGLHAAIAILVALNERDHTGQGQFLECTMVEGALNVAAEQVVEYTAYGHIQQREGNRSPYAAPQGLYACSGEENWLALSVETDRQWQALVQVLGHPDWTGDAALQTHAGRRAAQDMLDKKLQEWAREQDLYTVVEKLLAAGVPAATLLDCRVAFKHPQLAARGFLETVTHPVIGTHPLPSLPARFASRGDAPWIHTAAPTLGQHNHEVLTTRLGLDDTAIQSLADRQIIGTQPVKN